MGQYKVPQDVEAEDKLIGPLSLRQFIYVVIGLGWGALMWRLLMFNIVIMILAIIPITGFFLLLGFGRRQEQSFENYFVALVQFMFVPRIRMWDKDLTQEEMIKVEIKKPELVIEKNIPKSRLQQLALIMDTHGAQKDPTIQLQDENNQSAIIGQRILDPNQIAKNIGETRTQVVTPQDDVLDQNSARSEEVNNLLENVEANIHQEALKNIESGIEDSSQIIPTKASKPIVSNDILKKAMLQSNNLTVEQIAKETNEQVMAEGQSIKIAPST